MNLRPMTFAEVNVQTETYHLHKHADRILPFDDTTHGSSGPIQVSYGGHRQTTIMEQFMEACEARGYSVDNEMQDLKSCNGAAVSATAAT